MTQRFECLCIKFTIIDAEKYRAGFGCSCPLKQIDPRAIAVKDLPSEYLAPLDLLRLDVDHRHLMAARLHDLRHRLAKTALPDDDDIRWRRRSRIDQHRIAFIPFPGQSLRKDHQEWRGRHRQGDDRAKQARGFRFDKQRPLRRSKQYKTKFTALAQQQRHDDRGPVAQAEKPAQPENNHGFHRNEGGRQSDDQQRLFDDHIKVEHHAHGKEEQPQ